MELAAAVALISKYLNLALAGYDGEDLKLAWKTVRATLAQVPGLQTAVSETNATVAADSQTLSSMQTSMTGNVNTLSGSVANASAAITALAARVKALEDKIANKLPV